MFFSFLVPKISTTISSTISQCQMLNEPMMFLLDEELARILGQPFGPRPRPAHDVHVEVLAPPAARRRRC